MAKKGNYTYDYPRPALCSDIIILRKVGEEVEVLLIERKYEPFKHSWAFPGGFCEPDETCLEAAVRELEEETGIREENLTQLQTFSAVDRDPRGRVVSVVYYGILKQKPEIKAGDDAKNVRWFSVQDLPPLAFDHDSIMSFALKHIII